MAITRIELTLRETDLFKAAVSTAVAEYHRLASAATNCQRPVFGLDDQPEDEPASKADMVAASAAMLALATLRELQDDFSLAISGSALQGPVGMAYGVEGISGMWDEDAHELTISYEGDRTSLGYLVLLAVFQANLNVGAGKDTMALLERLTR